MDATAQWGERGARRGSRRGGARPARACTETQLHLWPVSVRATLPCSRSHILSVPPEEPAITVCSAESNETHSTALVWPDRLCAPRHTPQRAAAGGALARRARARTMMALGLPTAHTLTRLSLPPVTITDPVFLPTCTQFTAPPCATNSSAQDSGARA